MSGSVMLLLADVVFSVNTTTYEQLTRSISWQWQAMPVIAGHPVYQYVGVSEQTISIAGVVYPGQIGSREQLVALEREAGRGVSLPLFSGLGYDLGTWCITRFSETNISLFDNGCPKKIDFTIDMLQFSAPGAP